MEACSNYNEHEWRKNVCRNCFQKKHDHSSVQATATTNSTVSSSTSDIKPNSLSTDSVISSSTSDIKSNSLSTNQLTDVPTGKSIHTNEIIPCRYGINCYSRHPTHFQQYSHPPGFRAESVATNQRTDVPTNKSICSNETIPCRYGINCYSRNPTHLQQYFHPPGFRAEQVAINQVTDLSSQQKTKLDDIHAKVVDDLHQQKNKETNSQKIADLEKKLIEQQIDLEKHLHLAEERFRASMTDSEVKLKDYEGQIETLQRNMNAMAKYHQQLEHALGDELDKRERREIEQKRILSIKRDTPSYWGTNAFEQPYREINIHNGSVEFNIISELLNDTIGSHGHNYGTVYRKDPTEFIVTKIRRVQNDKLWHEYCFKKEQIIQRNNHNVKTCASSKYLEDHPFLTPLLDTDANEYWLFHGCDRAIVPFLVYSGYDPRVSSLHGMFGGGFYLAENSSKSNQYIPCPGCGANAISRDSGCKCQDQENIVFLMLLYRAVLGDVHVAQIYDKKKYRGGDGHRVRRPPLKDNGIDLYDSVLGESVKYGGDRLQYREVILYESGQAYPEYVIEFRRSATNAKPSRGVKHVKERCFDFFRNTFNLRPE